jgi:CheY-like chemotaxis protein
VQSSDWAVRRVRTRKIPPSLTERGLHPTDLYPSKCLEDPVVETSTLAEISPKISPLRILIIEDSITIILIVTKLLENKGHTVESCKNGFSGLNRLKEVFNTRSDFDLVLLDVQMPVMDGFECVSRYRMFEVDQLKNLSTAMVNKRKKDTLKLLLHSKYFRISYANNLTNKSVNVDNFRYNRSPSMSERTSGAACEDSQTEGSEKVFSNLPKHIDSFDIEEEAEAEAEAKVDTYDENKDDGGSLMSNSCSNKSDIMLRRGNMAIVGMSANSDNESRIQALRKGMNFFITKPFSNTDLQNILNLFGP